MSVTEVSISENFTKHVNFNALLLQNFTYDAVASMKYLDQVFCETTRLYPSVQRYSNHLSISVFESSSFSVDRCCNKTCKIGDYVIEKGDIVNVSIYSIQRDAEYWPEPDKFKPERFVTE